MKKRFLLLTCFTALILSVAAVAQAQQDAAPLSADPGKSERVEIARKLNDVSPARVQIESAIARVADNWSIQDRQGFIDAMMKEIDIARIEESSINVMADVFTKEELSQMLTFYSTPEAKKITEKMPIYQGLVTPAISKEIDRALMSLRTGLPETGARPAATPPQVPAAVTPETPTQTPATP